MWEEKVHPSHRMTKWEGAVVTLIATARFGEIRSCKLCAAEEARTVAGHAAHPELARKCTGTGEGKG
jgi:hypothetical protein